VEQQIIYAKHTSIQETKSFVLSCVSEIWKMNKEVDCGWANFRAFSWCLERVIYGNSRQQAKLIPKAMAKAKLGMQIPLFYFLPFFSFS
jgi:hypothetical protein